MAFHDGFDLPPLSAAEPAKAQTDSLIPLETEWYFQTVEDALSTLERMPEFPRRRDVLLRGACEGLAALEELTLGRKAANADWRTFVADMRDYTRLVAQRATASSSVGTLLELDLISQRVERAAAIARGALKDYFLRVALSYAA